MAPKPFTLTVAYRAKWWKRPFLWLLRRPTSHSLIVPDCKIVGQRINPDGSVEIDWVGKNPDLDLYF
jgi:hypothetical protein